MIAEIKDAFVAMSLKDGDVVFVDHTLIDLESLSRSPVDESFPKVWFVAIQREPGESIADAIKRMPRSEALAALKILTEESL